MHQNGVIKHRFGVYTNEDIEDPAELLKATYKELQRLSVPIVTFKANLLDLANAIENDVWIGDSVGIVRDQIGISFEARIHKLTIDKLDNNRSVAELGDYQTLQSKDRATRQQAIKEVVKGFTESLFDQSIANEVERRNKEIDEKVRIIELEIDNALKEYKHKTEELGTKIHEEMEKERPEFVKRIREELMSGADSIAELSKKLEQVSETARINAGLIGGDGTAIYNKNRLNGSTAKKIAYGTDFVEVGHNGEGFELGKQYVISWSATCTPYGKTDVTVIINKTPFYGGHVHFAPINSPLPEIDKDLTQKEEQVLSVYNGNYRLTLSGNWYQSTDLTVTIDNRTNRFELEPVYKNIADGQNSIYDGSWNESPTFIFDGGRT